MAGLNQMQTGQRLQAALAQRYGIQSPAAPALATEVFPVINVSDARIDPELQFLQQTTLGIGTALDPAAVGLESAVGLSNEVGSGVIAVVEAIYILHGSGAQRYWIRKEGGTLSTPDFINAGWTRDSRQGADARTAIQLVTLTSAATPGNGIFQINVLANETFVFREPIILAGQSRIWIQPEGVTNVTARASFLWRERPINTWETIGSV